jgi:Sugar (and other) transporter
LFVVNRMMMGELFASDVKGVASAIAVMFNWTLVFIITKTFGMMMNAWGAGKLITEIFVLQAFLSIS